MNKLNFIEKMGFKITWKLICIGLWGTDKIPVQITYAELFDYLEKRLNNNDLWLDEIVLLICEKDNQMKIHDLLCKFADEESSDFKLQERKWRAYLFYNILDNLSDDCLQGLLQLMEFWTLIGLQNESPIDFPKSGDKLSFKNYFTSSTYKQQIIKSKDWLENEMKTIAVQES